MKRVSDWRGKLKTETATLVLKDSRRLTGPNLVSDGLGAVIDVSIEEHTPNKVVGVWRKQAQRVLGAVGWDGENTFARTYEGGASLVISAPADVLYAATEVNEWAWEATQAELEGKPVPSLDEATERLRKVIAKERNPSLLALQDAARAHNVMFLSDDDHASVGMGVGSLTWPVDSLPSPEEINWDSVRNIPVALVTGSNGKTTTVRLVAAMARSEGKTPGYCCTDGIFVGEELIEEGDYSGPGGGRSVLRHRDVEVAILETARGGILRRGLTVTRADAAIVTNVAADHLGEYGIAELREIAEAKLVVRNAVTDPGSLTLNLDDEILAEYSDAVDKRVTWITLNSSSDRLQRHTSAGGAAAYLDDKNLAFVERGTSETVTSVDDVPITVRGAASYNVLNCLGAIALARRLGIPIGSVRDGLNTFGKSVRDNPGRTNLFEFGDTKVLVDFAHNPHGMEALLQMADSFPATRKLVILGQAGDRDDESIRQLARTTLSFRPDAIVIKEMRKYLRGREPGEIPDMIEDELTRSGYPSEFIIRADSEFEAVRKSLEWAQDRDLLLMPIHAHRDTVLELLSDLKNKEWRPGQPVSRAS